MDALTLSPAEKFLVGVRLEGIQKKTKAKAREFFSNALSSESAVNIAKDIVVIFPGAGGPDQFTSELCETMMTGRKEIESSHGHSFVEVFDWSEHRGSLATAAFDAEAVGESVADVLFSLNSDDSIRSIHSVGISVGGFAGNAFARRSKELGSNYVRLTLLDPFCSRGLLVRRSLLTLFLVCCELYNGWFHITSSDFASLENEGDWLWSQELWFRS